MLLLRIVEVRLLFLLHVSSVNVLINLSGSLLESVLTLPILSQLKFSPIL